MGAGRRIDPAQTKIRASGSRATIEALTRLRSSDSPLSWIIA
jgi:hypothetical protein